MMMISVILNLGGKEISIKEIKRAKNLHPETRSQWPRDNSTIITQACTTTQLTKIVTRIRKMKAG